MSRGPSEISGRPKGKPSEKDKKGCASKKPYDRREDKSLGTSVEPRWTKATGKMHGVGGEKRGRKKKKRTKKDNGQVKLASSPSNTAEKERETKRDNRRGRMRPVKYGNSINRDLIKVFAG